MFSERLQSYAHEKYANRLPVMGPAKNEVEENLPKCTQEEQVLIKFLYGTMPIRDTGEYGFDVFLGFVKHSLMIYHTMDWCKEIPEDMFLHHILYYRINSENIEDCRGFFYEQLIERVKKLTIREAVLEINYWCAENGTYEASDSRTISPVTLYRSGLGRCGEESTFAVTAFRSVGIPARQVYTPRWAHCDDNHAWVEVYVDGIWQFLGACEPEEVLNKGWFTNASSRALLIHTRTFSDYTCEAQEECLGQEELLFYYNDTAVYARTKNYEILVQDVNQQPVEHALVSVEILNSAEYCSVAELYTDRDGKAFITLGLGDIHLTAVKDEYNCEAIAHVKDTEQIVLTLKMEESNCRSSEWRDADIEAPVDYPMHPVTLTRAQKEKNRARLRNAAKMRGDRIHSYFKEKLADNYPGERELLTLAAGNFEEIYSFLSKDENPDRKALLHSLSVKDYKDAKAEILESHLASAVSYRSVWETGGQTDIYIKYILCPRIFFEEMTAYREVILNKFSTKDQEAFRNNPLAIWEYINKNITFDSKLDYSTICSTPIGSLKLKQGNPLSLKLLFVAICRTLGIPARMNHVNQEAEVYLNGAFFAVSKAGKEESGEKKEFGRVILTAQGDNQWNYYQTWTIGRKKNGRYVTLDYTGTKFEEGRAALELEPGNYRLLTSSRLPSGNQLASEYCFTLTSNETKEIGLHVRTGNLAELLVSNHLEDFDLTSGGVGTSAAVLTQHHANILAFLSEGQEPTEHVLNEMLEQQKTLNSLDAQIWFVLQNEEALTNKTLNKVLDAIPGIRLAYGEFEEIVEPLARRMYVDPDKLPLLIVTNPGLNGIYGCSGYNVGSVDMMVKLMGISRDLNKKL